jgi:hypothetical protein
MSGSNLSRELMLALLERDVIKGDTATAMLALCLHPGRVHFDVAKKLIEEHGASIDKVTFAFLAFVVLNAIAGCHIVGNVAAPYCCQA